MSDIYIKDSIENLRRILCKELSNNVFHITSLIGYNGICYDGVIFPSNHENIKNHIWGSSEYGRYFTNRNCISVVDFYNNTNKEEVSKAIEKYKFYNPHIVAKNNIAYFMVLKDTVYSRLITWEKWKDDQAYGEQIVPHLESGIRNKILLQDIDYILKVETNEEYQDLEKVYSDFLKNSLANK